MEIAKNFKVLSHAKMLMIYSLLLSEIAVETLRMHIVKYLLTLAHWMLKGDWNPRVPNSRNMSTLLKNPVGGKKSKAFLSSHFHLQKL